jgi:hypothetical protein
MKALERMGETKKRTSREFDGDSKPKKTRRGTSELVEYLKQRSGTDSELRREELAIKKNEQEIQKQTASQAAAQQLEMMRMMQEQNNDGKPNSAASATTTNVNGKSLRRNKEILFTGYVLCS